MDAKHEAESAWTRFVPIQVSALTTLAAGMIRQDEPQKDPDNRARTAGLLVGGAWLATTLALSATYHPMQSAWSEIEHLPAKTPREQLVRERMSEEALQDAASMRRRLNWLSFATQAGTGVFMAAKSKHSDFNKLAAATTIAAALVPVVFRSRVQKAECEQREYKKKIYAPIASGALLQVPGTSSVAPGLVLSFLF
jgi:hypothetical protein